MIESIAIIGAGNMGSGIAQKSATEGFQVQMVDREQQWVDKGHGIIENFLGEALERRIFSPDKAEEIKRRITGVVGNENVSPDTDLVIEAVFEDYAGFRLRLYDALLHILGSPVVGIFFTRDRVPVVLVFYSLRVG